MSLEAILSNVEKTGNDQSESIQEATKKEIAEKLSETKKIGKEIEKEGKEASSKIVEQMERQQIPAAELEVRRRQLDIQRQILEETHREVIEKLNDIDESMIKKIYVKLLMKAPQEGVLRCREIDSKMMNELTSDSECWLIDTKQTFDGPGFIVEGDDFRVDYRFETLVGDMWQDKLSEVNGVLFENE
ncbi:MAG: hypothetical protein BEU04_04445 [Marine Group III euryarchaeote CG-Bathy1]|uniref:V-type proton ATPase subunit E n=1 Tax=Marine Group III euryarchaeote CG-Bathy1 TaxID=1889001 RepID=A0A1J5U436_9ARCH|nr:MAG: hypothetical protein BEU04_04445 [Marine Group III euryarchaeote CG-Bathy1]